MKNSSKIAIAAAAGVAIGSSLGILLAPEKGVETRKKLEKKLGKVRNSLNGDWSKEKLMIASQKLEQHKKRVEMHLQRINAKLEKAEAKNSAELPGQAS
jgi:gas vesicle protein